MAHGKIETDYTEDYLASKIIHTYFFLSTIFSVIMCIFLMVNFGFWLHWFLLLCLSVFGKCLLIAMPLLCCLFKFLNNE